MTIKKNNYSIEEFVKQNHFEKCVSDLLEFIEKDNEKIKNLLIDKFSGVQISEADEEKITNYFIFNSVFSAATVANPATSVVTELLYERPKKLFPIDRYFLASKGGSAIYSRIINVEKNLQILIEKYLKKGKVAILNLGGGPSRDIINVLVKNYSDAKNIKVISIDRDNFTNKRGRLSAKINNVEDKIEFLDASFMRYKTKEKFDIILLVGVLCGLPAQTCVLILKKIKGLLAKNGCIVASNVDPKMLNEDPFTYFIMEKIVNWKLIFKEKEELKNIFIKAGLKWQDSFNDDYGYHNMGIGTKKTLFS